MAKKDSVFICESCGISSPKWAGQCRECGSWNSLIEEKKKNERAKHKGVNSGCEKNSSQLIEKVSSESYKRIKTGISEFDRVLGGGIATGSLILVGGEPGIGKSTLLTKVMDNLSKINEGNVLYISGEESVGQIANRAKRLGISKGSFYVLNETSWQSILSEINRIKPKFVVIDSIQTTVSEDITSPPGTISQIREVTYEIMNQVKSRGINCFIVGHITKDGQIAGPKILEHMVDTVLYFEGDQFGQYRIVRAIKNRFGNTNEVGLFEMRESGLEEVKNPSKYFIDDLSKESYGRSLTCVLEGSRPLFVEIQALVVENKFGSGRRTTHGLDTNRVGMIVAVLEKYLEISLISSDIFVNVAGGMKLNQRESDLSIIASIYSSFKKKEISEGTVFVGEVGLTGEIRKVPEMEKRLNEIAHLNFTKVVTGHKAAEEFKKKNYPFEMIGLSKVKEVINNL
jgi:DNA repair protein RadA/Sms